MVQRVGRSCESRLPTQLMGLGRVSDWTEWETQSGSVWYGDEPEVSPVRSAIPYLIAY